MKPAQPNPERMPNPVGLLDTLVHRRAGPHSTVESKQRSLGAYRLLDCIGSGSMGRVYRAQHSLLGRMVAIKILRPELACDEAFVTRFLAEARAVNLIGHQHVIDVTDIARDKHGTPWFVMELLEGCDLAAMQREQAIELRRAFELVRQLCEALSAVHAAGIVHRDVKPENLFISQREGADFVKLLDFGVARLPDPTSKGPLVTQEGLVGTPPYMAPEQLRSLDVDHRADLYSVGVVLFELITGRLPLWHADLRVLLLNIETVLPPAPSSLVQLPAAIREGLDTLIRRCLDKDRAQRPSSAQEIAASISVLTKRLEQRPLGPRPFARIEPLPIAPSIPLTPVPAPIPTSLPTLVRDRAERSRHASSGAPRLAWAMAAGFAFWWLPLSLGRNDSLLVVVPESPIGSSTVAAQPPAYRVLPNTSVATTDDELPAMRDSQQQITTSERRARRASTRARAVARAAQNEPPSLLAPSGTEPVVVIRRLTDADERSAAIVSGVDHDVVLNPF